MNPYIRDFTVSEIKTESVLTCNECDQVVKINEETPNFKVLHSNIRSIKKNLNEFECYLNQFSYKPDCIILTETWQIQDLTLHNIEGYNVIYNNSIYNQNDGIVIYIKSDYEFSHNIVALTNNNIVSVCVKYFNKDICIVAAYRSPSTLPNVFVEDIRNFFMNSDMNKVDYFIFVGDINIDILKNTDSTVEYLNIMSEFGLISTINDYTRCQDTSKSCIDHMFIKTKSEYEFLLPIIIKTSLTDHYFIYLQIIIPNKLTMNNILHNNKIERVNYNKLKARISKVDWNTIYQLDDVEAITKEFINIVNTEITKSTNIIKIKNKKRRTWITNGLITSINERDKMYQQIIKDPNNRILKENYITYRNMTNNLIRKTKTQYFQKKIEKNKKDTKHLWNTVKEICSQKKVHNRINSIFDNGQILTDGKLITNNFNNHYVTVGKKLADQIIPNPNYDKPRNKNIINSMYITPTNSIEINGIILSLRNGKAAGIDGVKAEVLKIISPVISEPLAYIINKCFEKGHYPSAFKTSIVLPIYKSGDRKQIINFRPISLITTYSKIFEKVLKKRLCGYLNKYNIISNRQYGFREGISTQDAILQLTSKMYSALDSNKPSLCVFIDLAKAFDTVSHTLLLESLNNIGIRGSTLDLFESYLSGRHQCVKINDFLSDLRRIEYGVPQGTVLGPILFNIYLNDLFSVQTKGNITTYADDTAIFYTAENWMVLKHIVEEDINNIKEWFDSKLLTVNFNKTYYLPICSNKNSLPTFQNLTVSNQFQISCKTEFKYLGIIIDSHLKWDKHVIYITKKLLSLIYKIKTLRNVLNIDSLKIIYYSLVESHINYGILAWGGVGKTILNKLIIVQKKILKIMFNKEITYPSERLFKETRLLDPRQLFFYHSMLHQQKTKHNLKKGDHKYNTRNKDNLYLPPFMKKAIGQKSYAYLSSMLYNQLPIELQNISNLNIFKYQLKQFIFTTPRDMIHDMIDLKL